VFIDFQLQITEIFGLATSNNIFYSTDNGDTWQEAFNGCLPDYFQSYFPTLTMEHPISGSIFIGAQDGSYPFHGKLLRLNSKNGNSLETVLDLPNAHHFIFTDMVVKASGDIYGS